MDNYKDEKALDSELLKSISKSDEFVKKAEQQGIFQSELLIDVNNITFRDAYRKGEYHYIFSEDIVNSHAKRLKELCKDTKQSELAKICNISDQAMSNIVNGKTKAVNIEYCNAIATYFGCSAFYILGLTDNPTGIVTDTEQFNIPITLFDSLPTIDITRASMWAKTDPKLFELIDKLFHANPDVRQSVYTLLKHALK
ncbi:helix-turn-helix domain-containing protein [Flavonifractor sp. HCP28S3_F3]|uniref:helix-turn-helix domain-containing protein n=1 Tax=Flavonifractor sp. HCP28S3_F3 TaxID=3438939 RepID=UPI003F892A23